MKQAARASHTADAHLLLASCHSNSGRWVQWYPRFEVLILLPHQVYSCVIAMSCITLMPLLENSWFFFPMSQLFIEQEWYLEMDAHCKELSCTVRL